MKLVVEMDLDNAAFTDNGTEEVSRILADIATRLPDPLDYTGGAYSLHDINGNHVGTFGIISDEEATRPRRHLDELARLIEVARKHPNNYAHLDALTAVVRLALASTH